MGSIRIGSNARGRVSCWGSRPSPGCFIRSAVQVEQANSPSHAKEGGKRRLGGESSTEPTMRHFTHHLACLFAGLAFCLTAAAGAEPLIETLDPGPMPA